MFVVKRLNIDFLSNIKQTEELLQFEGFQPFSQYDASITVYQLW